MTNIRAPLISVVVIGLNEEKLIGRCMESLARQQCDIPYEVIFVDGGSKDRTVEIVKQFVSKIRVKIIIQNGKGIGEAREEGFRAATASIIASTDSDIILPIDWIKRIYHYLKTHPNCLGVVGPYTVYPGSQIFKYVFVTLIRFFDFIGKIISGFHSFRGMNFGIRKDAWIKTGGFERTISALEDVDLALRVSKFGQICYLSTLIVETTPRRFNKDILSSTIYRILAYYHRVFLRNYKYGEWKQIREN